LKRNPLIKTKKGKGIMDIELIQKEIKDGNIKLTNLKESL